MIIQDIKETTLSRVLHHIRDTLVPILIISAFRGEYSYEENIHRNKNLALDVKRKGYGYFFVDGYWTENKGFPDERKVKEESIFIVGDNHKQLKQEASYWINKYKQEAALLSNEVGNVITLYGDGSEEDAGEFSLKILGDMFTKLRGRGEREFTFESLTHIGSLAAPVIPNDALQADSRAAWISPAGKMLRLPGREKHIDHIIENPSAYGLTDDYLNKVYAKHGEDIDRERLHQLGTANEGKAREEILIALIEQGWIRTRFYTDRRDQFWSITVNYLDGDTKVKIMNWAQKQITEKGPMGDKYMPVKINPIDKSKVLDKSYTVQELAQNVLLSESTVTLLEVVNSADEFEEIPTYDFCKGIIE